LAVGFFFISAPELTLDSLAGSGARREVASYARMSEERRRWRRGPGGCGCLSGCGTFIFVFLLGGLLSLFGSVLGLGVSIGIPLTQSNVTVAGSIGTKAKISEGLPSYVRDRLAGNQNFINQSGTLTVGPAEGAAIFVVGGQEGAPAIDLYVVLR
jgi:hypothetical protein